MFVSDSEILDLRILNEVKYSDSVSGQYLKLIVKAKITLLVRSKGLHEVRQIIFL